jgi:hypothetical protein
MIMHSAGADVITWQLKPVISRPTNTHHHQLHISVQGFTHTISNTVPSTPISTMISFPNTCMSEHICPLHSFMNLSSSSNTIYHIQDIHIHTSIHTCSYLSTPHHYYHDCITYRCAAWCNAAFDYATAAGHYAYTPPEPPSDWQHLGDRCPKLKAPLIPSPPP